MISSATDLLVLAKLATPYFGNDINRVLWEADLLQVIALARIELGVPGEDIRHFLAKVRERTLLMDKLAKVKV